jgi:hypothetical protein
MFLGITIDRASLAILLVIVVGLLVGCVRLIKYVRFRLSRRI